MQTDSYNGGKGWTNVTPGQYIANFTNTPSKVLYKF